MNHEPQKSNPDEVAFLSLSALATLAFVLVLHGGSLSLVAQRASVVGAIHNTPASSFEENRSHTTKTPARVVPSCPFLDSHTTSVVQIGSLLSGVRGPLSATVPAHIAAGRYAVYAFGYDQSADRRELHAKEPQEYDSWMLELRSLGETVATLGPTTQLEDGVAVAFSIDTLTESIDISMNIDEIIVRHAYPFHTYNRVVPACVAFSRVP